MADDAPDIQNDPSVAATDTSALGMGGPLTAPPTAQQRLRSINRPGMPALISMLGQMRNPTAQVQPGQMPQAPSRLDSFESFLGNFLTSLASGMAASGHGPGANERGAAAAIMAPREQNLQNFQMQQQAAQQQSEMQQRQAQAELERSQASGVYVPGVGVMPAKLAENLLAAQTRAQATTQAATTRAGAAEQVAQITTKGRSTDEATRAAMQYKIAQLKASSDQRVAQIRAGGVHPVVVMGPNGPTYVLPSQALGQRAGRAASPADIQKTTQNQGQLGLAMDRMKEIRDNADVISSLLDAGKISLAIGAGGNLEASIGRGVKLTDREKKFASDFQSMSEDINLLRGPLGATGFRSAEAFNALQAQRGRLAQNPQVFLGVIENSLASMQKLQDANADFLSKFGGSGGPTSTPTGRRVVNLMPPKQQ